MYLLILKGLLSVAIGVVAFLAYKQYQKAKTDCLDNKDATNCQVDFSSNKLKNYINAIILFSLILVIVIGYCLFKKSKY